MSYEYKVVPAPMRGLKAKGVKSPEDRFAYALQTAMNDLAADGWEYLRADTLPSEQREGLMSKTTVFQNMLVFRRAKTDAFPAVQASVPQLEAPRPKTGEERLAEIQTLREAAEDDEPLEIGDPQDGGKTSTGKASPEVAAE